MLSTSEDSDHSNSDTEAPPTKKSRSLSGAAKYKSKFNSKLCTELPFISAVKNDPHRYVIRLLRTP